MEGKHQQAERRASEWLTRRDSGAWSADDQAALERWLDESPVHAVAFIRLEAAWTRADRYKALGAGFPPRSVPAPERVNVSPFFDEPVRGAAAQPAAIRNIVDDREPVAETERRRIFRRPLAIAASLALSFALGAAWYWQTDDPAFTTPVGGIASVAMQDGSHATLNTNSEIRVSMTDAERRVQLEHGEAFFEVTRDVRRPFVVSVNRKRVVAVGTAFSVRRDGANVRVAVTEGTVRFEDASADAPGRTADAESRGAFVLNAGGIAQTRGSEVLVQMKPVAEVQDTLSWRLGFVVFRDVNLAEAIAEFNRYNEGKIVIEDPALASIRLSGKFKTTNVDAFVRLLEEGHPIEARNQGTDTILMQRARQSP